MSRALPQAEVVRKSFDEELGPYTPVFALRWDVAPGESERLWELPEGLCITGLAPRRFGIQLKRTGTDAFTVRVVWDRTCMSWKGLSRVELLTSCLSTVLSAMGIEMWGMLDQPLTAGWSKPKAA